MGKATVIGSASGYGEKAYYVSIEKNVSEYDDAIQSLSDSITTTEAIIDELDLAVDQARSACDDAIDKLTPSFGDGESCFVASKFNTQEITIDSDLDGLPIRVLIEEDYAEVDPDNSTCPEIKPDLSIILPTVPEGLESCYEYASLLQQSSILKSKLANLYSQRSIAQDAKEKNKETVVAWYAGSYSDSIFPGKIVSTAEIAGKRENGVYITDERWTKEAYQQIVSTGGVHGMYWFFNAAVYPLLERERPTFRTATIVSLDYDNATAVVSYDDVTFTARNGDEVSLNGEFNTTALIVDEQILGCLVQGDRVVIRFASSTPVIVGFTEAEKTCSYDLIAWNSSTETLCYFSGSAWVSFSAVIPLSRLIDLGWDNDLAPNVYVLKSGRIVLSSSDSFKYTDDGGETFNSISFASPADRRYSISFDYLLGASFVKRTTAGPTSETYVGLSSSGSRTLNLKTSVSDPVDGLHCGPGFISGQADGEYSEVMLNGVNVSWSIVEGIFDAGNCCGYFDGSDTYIFARHRYGLANTGADIWRCTVSNASRIGVLFSGGDSEFDSDLTSAFHNIKQFSKVGNVAYGGYWFPNGGFSVLISISESSAVDIKTTSSRFAAHPNFVPYNGKIATMIDYGTHYGLATSSDDGSTWEFVPGSEIASGSSTVAIVGGSP